MKLLLVNDDGFDSPALHALCAAAAKRGHRVTVCAPMQQQSGKSHSFTIFDPVRVRPRSMDGADTAWGIEGTPVDCTRLGLAALTDRVDLVISGINAGHNAGLATYVSGTVGAAREAAFHGVRAMAVSLSFAASPDVIAWAADWTVRAAEAVLDLAWPTAAVLNLNLPAVPHGEVQPPVYAPISLHLYDGEYEKRVSPRGDLYYWLKFETPDAAPEPESDIARLQQNHITCTWLVPVAVQADAALVEKLKSIE